MSEAPRRVAMLIYAGVAPLDVAGPLQVFDLCNIMRGRQCYDVVTVATETAPVATSSGITFMPGLAMRDVALPLDTLLVAGGADIGAASSPEIARWLRLASAKSRRFGSICTGAFVLGAAGLLDGRKVTTHWLFAERLKERSPKSQVDIDPIFIRDGPLFTTAGITAGIDLGLALVEEDFGRSFALEVARHLVVYLKRSGGQEQFSTRLKAQISEVPAIQRVQAWCLDNLGGDLRIAALARQAAMSERNFARLFLKETGQSPGDFVAESRARAACRMLEDTTRSTQDIAVRCGYGSAAAMRRAFVHRFGVTPGEYRQKFSPLPANDAATGGTKGGTAGNDNRRTPRSRPAP